jgi:hypothetical protein
MIKYIYLAICIGFFSCVTKQKCNERFPPIQHDSVVTIVSYIDTVIYDTIIIPAGVVSIHDTIPCGELEFYREETKGGLKHTIHISKGVLNSTCKADSLVQVIDNLIKQKVTLTKAIKTNTIEVKTNELTKLQNFWIISGYIFWIALIAIAISVLIKKT